MAIVFCAGTFGLNFQMTTALMATEVYGKGAGEYGVLGSILAIGSLTGSLLAARRSESRQRRIVVAAVAFGVMVTVAGLMPSYLTFALVLPLAGFIALTLITSANAFVQMSTAPQLRGRVMALYMAIFMGGTPIGAPAPGRHRGALRRPLDAGRRRAADDRRLPAGDGAVRPPPGRGADPAPAAPAGSRDRRPPGRARRSPRAPSRPEEILAENCKDGAGGRSPPATSTPCSPRGRTRPMNTIRRTLAATAAVTAIVALGAAGNANAETPPWGGPGELPIGGLPGDPPPPDPEPELNPDLDLPDFDAHRDHDPRGAPVPAGSRPGAQPGPRPARSRPHRHHDPRAADRSLLAGGLRRLRRHRRRQRRRSRPTSRSATSTARTPATPRSP